MPPALPECGPGSERAGALLLEGARILGLELSAGAVESMLCHLAMLEKWNRAYNLSRLVAPEDAIPAHLLDSLAVARLIHGERVLDVGSGAGFPGLPLAMMDASRRYTLLDSRGKKTRFIAAVVRRCGPDNVAVVQDRVEQYRAEPKFDTLVTRAFSSLSGILSACGHLVAAGGRIVAMKGDVRDAEVAPLRSVSDIEVRIEAVDVPYLDAVRHVVIIEPGNTPA